MQARKDTGLENTEVKSNRSEQIRNRRMFREVMK